MFERTESILERRIRLDAEKQARGGAVRAMDTVRQAPTPEQQAEAARQAAAQVLPDAQFAEHSDVVSLRERLACLERIEAGGLAARQWLEVQAQRIEDGLADGGQAVVLAVLLDAVGKDDQFTKARAVLVEQQTNEALLTGMQEAVELARRPGLSGGSLRQMAADARAALHQRLMELKLAHVAKVN